MSKPFLVFVTVLIAFASAGRGSGQTIPQVEISIRIQQDQISVTGVSNSRNALSFLRSIAGVNSLDSRIRNLRLSNDDGASISFRQIAPGELVAERGFTRFTYDVDLTVPKDGTATAHASWIKGDTGIFFLRDLLPQFPVSQRVRLTMPADVPFYSNDSSSEKKTLIYDVPDEVVYYVGAGWRSQAVWRSKDSPILSISGEWHFTDVEAAKFVADLALAYQDLFGLPRLPTVQVAIARFPVTTEPGMWEAETVGRNVTIVSSDMPFKTQSLQRLHEQLRHELFHLWIPNGVNLTGNYDWFYEGFALYQSLGLAVSMNRIRFEDFLDTLSRAHTIDSAASQRLSLIDASKSRFAGSNTQVYARGMLVAFLTDLAMLERSKGKRSIEDMLREFYAKHRKPNTAVDGNAAALESLRSNAGEEIVSKYVSGIDKIDWTKELALAGISDSDPGPITTLRVNGKLSGRQKTLLDKLGYNNWRKLSPGSK